VSASSHRDPLPHSYRRAPRISPRPMCFGTSRRKTGEGERVSLGEGAEMKPTILVSKRGVQEQYGIPINTQEDLYRKGLFAPQLKVGGKIYYRRSELEAWLDAHTAGGDGTA
jgi:hypothetical protein